MRNVTLFCACFLLLLGCSHKEVPHKFRGVASLKQTNEVEGIWYLQGSNAVRGPYTGELELRHANDGTYTITRVVNYISYYYEGLRVQEVWTGKALPSDSGLVVTYSMDDQQTMNEFFKPTKIETLEATFVDQQNTTYKEWVTTKRSLEEKPLRWIASDFYQKNYAVLRVANHFIDKQSLSDAFSIRLQMLKDLSH